MTEPKQRGRKRRSGAGADAGNQGEGNRAADRRYREKASDFARSGEVEPAAEEARRSLAGDAERDAGAESQLADLERAERQQRRRLEGEKAPPGTRPDTEG